MSDAPHPFAALGIPPDMIRGLEELGITTPTEVQKKVIPFLLTDGSDLIAQAQTGTGKTAAFGLPLLTKMNPKHRDIQGLVLAPTRELAKQIGKQLFRFTKYTDKIFIEVLSGGDNIDRQTEALRRPTHIVVATPGRLLDLIERDALTLEFVRYVVLDEADEMLSMGFKKQLTEILKLAAMRRSTWLFSATFPRTPFRTSSKAACPPTRIRSRSTSGERGESRHRPPLRDLQAREQVRVHRQLPQAAEGPAVA
jgi:ATP-dependent RNA helicase DeaD